jgi:hypothetical protein
MNKEFARELTELLDNECRSYNLSYEWEYDPYNDEVNVEVHSEYSGKKTIVNFRWRNHLEIELTEDSWYQIEWFEPTIKYFWMIVSRDLF